ncbi:hypothetical protein BH11CYA1_BH11CYA1_26490 [soil metagenome]
MTNSVNKPERRRHLFFIYTLLALVTALLGYIVYDSKKPRYRSTEITPTTRDVVVIGEVVDAWCYASQTMGPGRGPGHRACALACAHGGVSIGILEDGTKNLYVAAKYKGFQGCKDLLIPYMGEKVKAVGWVGDLGGCRMLKIKTVDPLTKPNLDDKLEQPAKP